jgi:hypothetical protein
VILDLFSRQVVGWSMKPHMRQELVVDALRMAWFRRRPALSTVIQFFPSWRCGMAAAPAIDQPMKMKAIAAALRSGETISTLVAAAWGPEANRRFVNQGAGALDAYPFGEPIFPTGPGRMTLPACKRACQFGTRISGSGRLASLAATPTVAAGCQFQGSMASRSRIRAVGSRSRMSVR